MKIQKCSQIAMHILTLDLSARAYTASPDFHALGQYGQRSRVKQCSAIWLRFIICYSVRII